MAISPDGKRTNTCIDIMSQNLRGFKEDKEEEKNLLPTLTPGMSEL